MGGGSGEGRRGGREGEDFEQKFLASQQEKGKNPAKTRNTCNVRQTDIQFAPLKSARSLVSAWFLKKHTYNMFQENWQLRTRLRKETSSEVEHLILGRTLQCTPGTAELLRD